MSVELHRKAEVLMGEMDAAIARKDWLAAAKAADDAADCESRALTTIPPERIRTRAIIAESAGALRARAEVFRAKSIEVD